MLHVEALEREALRVFDRYCTEIVEELNLCPFAIHARMRVEVSLSDAIAPAEIIAADSNIDIGFVLYPLSDWNAVQFDGLVEQARAMHSAVRRDTGATFAFATFHPEAKLDLRSPHTLVSFLRRTPDPTIQMIRLSALERVRSGDPPKDYFAEATPPPLSRRTPLHERIGTANYQTIQTKGPSWVEACINDIIADRDRSYRAVLGGAGINFRARSGRPM